MHKNSNISFYQPTKDFVNINNREKILMDYDLNK